MGYKNEEFLEEYDRLEKKYIKKDTYVTNQEEVALMTSAIILSELRESNNKTKPTKEKMMREIKFRGKTHTEEWVYGSLVILKKKYYICSLEDLALLEVYKESIGEYTGLKDKNNKEIYEGDIVKILAYENKKEEVYFGKIKYLDYCYGADVLEKSEQYCFYHLQPTYWEVIGNIYENPELLGGKEDD